MKYSENLQASIYWLVSYPKSGNTWVRTFIANLQANDLEPVDINELQTGAIASSREWVQGALDFDINELTHDEVDYLRPEAYCWLSQQMAAPQYHKIHDAYTRLANGDVLIPPVATCGSLYIVRNPLDVVVSFAHHNNCSVDQTITNMANPEFCGGNGEQGLHYQLRQRLLSWSAHVLSWLNAEGMNVALVRYEDMKCDPLNTFTKVARFLELPYDKISVEKALSHSGIEKLQAQEAKNGFKEKSQNSVNFFRKGIVGDWQKNMTEEQVQRVIDDHRDVMLRLGYLDNDGLPVRCFERSLSRINDSKYGLSPSPVS